MGAGTGTVGALAVGGGCVEEAGGTAESLRCCSADSPRGVRADCAGRGWA